MTKTKAKAQTPEVQNPPADKPLVPRDERGRFPAGVSGNPAGRAKGTKNRITLARLLLEEQLRTILEQNGPKLMKKAIDMALKDDNDRIMRVLLDKMLATPKGDDSEGTGDREVKVVIQNLTSTKERPAIDVTPVRVPLPPKVSPP